MNEIRLSVSKVKCFSDCAKKYKYSYILKLPKKEHLFFTFGSVLHAALENFHLAYIKNGSTAPYNTEMTTAFKVAKAEYKDKMKPDMIKECFDILCEYLKIISTNKEHRLATPVIAAEKDFDLALTDNIKLIGMIDRIQIDGDGVLHVADYKTTKNKKYLAADFFQLQTYCYVLMLENPEIETIRASYILLRHGFEFLTKEFSRDEILTLRDQYLHYADSMATETDFMANPTKLCKYCDYINICEEGRKQMQLFNGEVNW